MSIITTWDERARLDYEALTTEQKVVALERDIELVKEAYRRQIGDLEGALGKELFAQFERKWRDEGLVK